MEKSENPFECVNGFNETVITFAEQEDEWDTFIHRFVCSERARHHLPAACLSTYGR